MTGTDHQPKERPSHLIIASSTPAVDLSHHLTRQSMHASLMTHTGISLPAQRYLFAGAVPVVKAKVPTKQRGVGPLGLARRCNAVEGTEILFRELYDLEIVDNALRRDRLGKNNHTLVDMVGDEDGGGRNAVLLGDSIDFGVRKKRRV